MAFGIIFKVLIMGSNHAIHLLATKLFQDTFSHCRTYLRFGASSKFVYQDERFAISLLHHILHVQQMRRVCT